MIETWMLSQKLSRSTGTRGEMLRSKTVGRLSARMRHMTESGVLTFNFYHIHLTHYLVAIWNVFWIDLEPIIDIEKALP